MTDAEGNLTGQAQGQQFFDRPVTAEQAKAAAHRLIGAAFNRKDARPQFRIPTQPDDDDVLLLDYIDQSEARLSQALEENERLQERVADLEEMNGYDAATMRLREAARVAEAKAALADEVFSHRDEILDIDVDWFLDSHWFARYDALTPAADAAEGGKG